MNPTTRSLLAEFLGTFTLVFVGAGAVIIASTPDFGANVVVPALGHGLILVGLIYIFGHISGAHFNPAVTLGLLIGGKITPSRAGLYMIAQFLGGIAAAFVLVLLIPDIATFGETKGSLTENYVWSAAGWEVVLTFFLVSSVYQAAVYEKAGNLAAVAIGFTLAGAILAGGPFGGASLNPSRTLGPALAAAFVDGADISYVLPYFVGIFAGGALGGLVHGYLLKPEA